MDSMKKEYIFLAIVIVVLVLYLVLRNQDKTHYSLPELENIEISGISRLVVTLPDSSITLEKRDNDWVIQPYGFPAAGNKLETMLKSIEDFELTDLVSQSKNYNRYDLSPEKRIGLEIYSDEKLVRMLSIGKTASTYRHTYVLLNDNPDVYQCQSNIRRDFDIEIKDLRDRSVLSFSRSAVNGVDIAYPGDTLNIVKAEFAPGDTAGVDMGEAGQIYWRTTRGERVDGKAFDKLVGAVNNLKCTGYINNKKKEDFTDPIYTISLDAPAESSLSIFEMTEDNKYPALSSQNDYPFLISKWKGEQIMKKREDLLEEQESGD
jgi:hypothetical protein